ncbi:MAG TPA: hypothetical protein VK966_06425, partial [Longimicrobiales bacterium]|nr:hypothetical protein [Longimicrobiales bacterium]
MADPHPDAISQDPAEFQAWHLPVEVAETEVDTAVPLSLVRPVPRPALVRAAAEALRAAGASLRRRPMAEIIAAIDAAAARLTDPADPIRKAADALLPRVTGYSPAMVDLVLDRMTADWRAGPLHRLVDVELPGNPLDAFSASSAAGGVRSRAYGPELCFQVFAG